MTRRPFRAAATSAFLAASALLLGACTTGPAATDATAVAAFEWVAGPLEEFSARIFGAAHEDGEQDSQSRFAASWVAQQDLVAACMAEHGFDYTPIPLGTPTTTPPDFSTDTVPPVNSREFAATYGFAISTDPWGSENLSNGEWIDPDTGQRLEVTLQGILIDPVTGYAFDPNDRQLAEMTPAARDEWFLALWGEPTEGEPTLEEWAQRGCWGAADAEILHVGNGFETLREEFNRFWDQVLPGDPQLARLHTDWASCMADAGYVGLTTPNAFRQTLMNEFHGQPDWNDPAFEEMLRTWDWEAHPDGPPLQPMDPAEFREQEITAALANYDCQVSTDFLATYQQISHELQAQFVERHAVDLEAWAQHEEARRDR